MQESNRASSPNYKAHFHKPEVWRSSILLKVDWMGNKMALGSKWKQ